MTGDTQMYEDRCYIFNYFFIIYFRKRIILQILLVIMNSYK